eukprot:CAMPEP_0117518030 /NCGR_PEP_ID=MMETSP0784-20121206/31918_1 /TAXON_ID=39447 /ORGANISM="" /LENGTH=457 /DNA_ID=CAMNT_0005313931 /DNA_START=54 /DNA_END=1427 /DNA_ORIENTATION=-
MACSASMRIPLWSWAQITSASDKASSASSLPLLVPRRSEGLTPHPVHPPGAESRVVGASHASMAKLFVAGGFAACARKRWARRTTRWAATAVGVPAASALMIQPDDCSELLRKSRPAHWVIRTSDLQNSLAFLSKVFGMFVLRHEEYDKPCAITCNGAFSTAWSKTMIGYGCEDENYCLELTYNYGIGSYETGGGLAYIGVGVDDPAATLAAATAMGYSVEGDVITGPDGYRYRVVLQPPERRERFQCVALRVAQLETALAFYEHTFGMHDLSADFENAGFAASSGERASVVGYCRDQVPLLLIQDESVPDSREQWEGRNAIAIPGRAMRAVYQRVLESTDKESGRAGAVLHPVREFNELPALRRMRGLPPMACKPPPDEVLRALRNDPASAPAEGTLAVAVVTDPDGYEICLVSCEAYDEAVARAYRPKAEIDWAWREDAKAGKRVPTPMHMLACV